MKKGTVAILASAVGAIASGVVIKNLPKPQKEDKVFKFKSYYNMLNQWLIIKQQGKSLEQYFIDHGYKSIAIYGMGEMGNRFYEELKDTSIEIKYAIDKNAYSVYAELDVLELTDEWEPVDAVVVTAIFAFDNIEEEIKDKITSPIISLEDIVYEV